MAQQHILASISTRDWAFHNISRQLEVWLPRYSFEHATLCETVPGRGYDGAIVFYWAEAERLLSSIGTKSLIVCFYDHGSWINSQIPTFLRVANRADCVVVGNVSLAQEIIAAGVKTPVEVCQDGVDLQMFPLRTFPWCFTIGWTGHDIRDGDFKGIELIRQAAKLAAVKIIEREYKHRIPHEEMAKQFYSHISCYVCASKSEGTPNPMLEALACGRPVITTRVGISEQVIHEGKTGVFVERDVNQIAEAIKEVASWDVRAHAPLCRQAVEGHSWEIAAKRWGEVLDKYVGHQWICLSGRRCF